MSDRPAPRVDFYHLERSPLEQVLPRIAERVLEQKQRLLVVAADDALARRLDECLWTYTPESFLPHGRAGGADDARQPVLIAADCAAANGARHVALADGVWRDEALAFDRVFHFFDGETIAASRAAWRALGAHAGIERHYWKQDDAGRWKDMG